MIQPHAELPGSGLFVRFARAELAGQRDARVGYFFAALATIVSGVSVYVNSLGVRSFDDPVVYTALKDGFVGIILLLPLALVPGWRDEYKTLGGRTWLWLILLALTGGSVPFALFFSGLTLTTAATGAVINHFQFVLVAVIAAVFLRERIRPSMWAGFAVLLAGTLLGTRLQALAWNYGAVLVGLSTLLFAVDFVIAKHLLRGLATLTVMTARMTLGTAMLLVYVIASGRLSPALRLDAAQWQFLIGTGLLLLAFTITTFTAIRHASVSAVLAIGSASPIITILLQVARADHLVLTGSDLAGIATTLLAVGAIMVLGVRQSEAKLETPGSSP